MAKSTHEGSPTWFSGGVQEHQAFPDDTSKEMQIPIQLQDVFFKKQADSKQKQILQELYKKAQ